jgi:uncharacterized protein (DUF2267 family)
MATTGLEVFDKTLHTTNQWLDEISAEIGPDRHLAWHVLGAVLRCIRDEMLVDQSAHLAAQLPLLVRGTYFDQYRPASQPVSARSQEQFIARIQEELAGSRPINPIAGATAVMRTLNRHLTEGQIRKARDALPKGVRALWPEPDETAKGVTSAPRAKEAPPATPGPSQMDPVEGSRDTVEHELKRTAAARGVPSSAQRAPGLHEDSGRPVDVESATAMSSSGRPNRGAAKPRPGRGGA